jgi:hypothetical protein
MGIVSGTHTRAEVLDLIRQSLACVDAMSYAQLVTTFNQHTMATYAKVREAEHVDGLKGLIEGAVRFVEDFIHSPEAQYDRHLATSNLTEPRLSMWNS